MKRIVFEIAVLASIIALIIVQLKTNKEISENRIYKYDKEAPVKVFAQKVAKQSAGTKKSFTGTFEPLNEVKINADVQGNIVEILVKEGRKVVQGQPLLKIDDQMLKLKLQAVKAKISGLQKDVERYEKLTQTDAVPGVKLEKTKIALDAARAEQQILEEQIANTTVKSPFNGIVTKQLCEVGSFALPAKPLFEISNLNQLKFRINVTENDLDLFTGKNYRITADINPNDTLNAELLFAGSKGTPANTFPVEFVLSPQDSKKLKSKMFGSVYVQNENDNYLIIPSKCIVGSDIRPKVYVIRNGKAVLVPITIARRNGDYILVKSGLKENDVVVTGGFINLFENANVTIANK